MFEKPYEITQDCDSGMNFASFDFYAGKEYTKAREMKQTTDFMDVVKNNCFIVSCGKITIFVQPTDFPEIERRII